MEIVQRTSSNPWKENEKKKEKRISNAREHGPNAQHRMNKPAKITLLPVTWLAFLSNEWELNLQNEK